MVFRSTSSRRKAARHTFDRTRIIGWMLITFAAVLIVRLGHIQVFQHGFYAALAEGQHGFFEELTPERGEILIHEDGKLFPLAANKDYFLVYAVPRNIVDRQATAKALADILAMPVEEISARLQKENDLYEPIKRQVDQATADKIRALGIDGIGFQRETYRYYPEKNIGSHLLGFVGFSDDKRVGQYGLEGYWNTELSGSGGYIKADRDAEGRLIAVGSRFLEEAKDGDDLVLTIDRSIQYKACSELDAAVKQHGATGGSVVILEPKTGKVLAMCGYPDFDPNVYNEVEDINTYLNPATYGVYEPGSVFKPITMAAAINEGKVSPSTTYEDTGSVEIGKYVIKNSDGLAHGVVDMSTVLEASLNTGAIFAARQIGPEKFDEYVRRFGFGEKTGIQLDSEQAGDVSSLSSHKEIYMATASYGQGITVSPLQIAAAFGALANSGMLMKPYLVEQIRKPDGATQDFGPTTVRQVVSPETAAKVSAMLVNVVRNGHGKRAGVPGYYVAGKTGTAQIPLEGARGYDPNKTIGTFVGFAPVDDPKFVMLTRIDKPQDVQFAESSAAPLFGTIASFLLQYLDVAPTAPIE